MANDIIVHNAYHGTSRINAQNIMKDGFTVGNSDDSWLGYGIYFFTEKERAIHYAATKFKNHSLNAILSVLLSYPQKQLLDLDIDSDIEKYKHYSRSHRDYLLGAAGGAPEFRKPADSRCYWINIFCEYNKDVSVVAMTFPAYDEFGMPFDVRQYCVKNNKPISDVRMEVLDFAI